MRKIYLTKEQGEFLDRIKKEIGFEKIMTSKINNWAIEDGIIHLTHLSLEDLAKALINGYEIKKTPKEKIKSFYDNKLNKNDDYSKGFLRGIEVTLEQLDVEIEGLNDETEVIL